MIESSRSYIILRSVRLRPVMGPHLNKARLTSQHANLGSSSISNGHKLKLASNKYPVPQRGQSTEDRRFCTSSKICWSRCFSG
eukprot:5421882-Amphidinium_carterae.1